jgi:hypothetical protein
LIKLSEFESRLQRLNKNSVNIDKNIEEISKLLNKAVEFKKTHYSPNRKKKKK